MGQYFNNFQGETLGQPAANTQIEWGIGNFSSSIINDSGTKRLRITTTAGAGNEQHLRFLRFPTNQQQSRALVKFRINSNFNLGSYTYPIVLMTNVSGSSVSKTFLAWNDWARGDSNIHRITVDRMIANGYAWMAQSGEFSLAANTWYWFKTENVPYSGSAQWNRAKIWQDGSAEPGWFIEYDHSANASSLMTGWFGIGPYSQNHTVDIAQIGLAWAGDAAPSTMPTAYTGTATAAGGGSLSAIEGIYQEKTTATINTVNEGGDLAWTNSGNIFTENASSATFAFFNGGQRTETLKLTNWGFSLPSNAQVTGIKVEIKGSFFSAYENTASLLRNNVAISRNKILNNLPSTMTWFTKGGQYDTWGENWTAADINNANFGYTLKYGDISGGDGSGAIDAVKMTVYYDVGPFHSVAQSFAGDTGLAYGNPQVGGGGVAIHEITNTSTNAILAKKIRYPIATIHQIVTVGGGKDDPGESYTFNFSGYAFSVVAYPTLTDATNNTNPIQTWNRTLASTALGVINYVDYDFDFTTAQTIAAGGKIFMKIDFMTSNAGGASPGSNSAYIYGSTTTSDANQVLRNASTPGAGAPQTTTTNELDYIMLSLEMPNIANLEGSSQLNALANVTASSIAPMYSGSEMTVNGQVTRIAAATIEAGSSMTTVANVGLFGELNTESSSSIEAVGSKHFYEEFTLEGGSEFPDVDALRTAITGAELSGSSEMSVNSTGIEITHLAITKNYVYKVYDKDWNYLGIWKDVISDFTYSQEINSAGSAITVTLARNSDSKIAQYESLGTDDDDVILTDDNNEIAAEMETVSAVGPGTDVDLNHNVKVYEFSTDPDQPVSGDLVFTGYISMYSSKYGSTENTSVSIFSYGADLDNWLLTEGNVTRVGYISQDPSDILKDTLDRFNADGGIVTYDEGTPGDVETIMNLVANPSFETNATGWTVSQGLGGRTSGTGGAFGTYYYYVQNMGGSAVDWQSPNLVSGQQYRFSFYLKRPASGSVYVTGSHNSAVVFDYYPTTGTTWQRYDIAFTATANAPLFVSFGISGSDNIVYIDGVMLTQGNTLYDYFDGDTTDDDTYTYSWTGTANASTSTRVRVLTNIGETITSTNTIVTYAFNLNTEFEVVKKLLELAPTDWYFYVDLASNLLHFHPRPETPDHYFYLGKHILNLDLEKSMEGIVNDLVLTGGKPTDIVRDNFFDTTGTLLHNHTGDLNATWVKHPAGPAGNLIITNNRVRPESATETIYMVSGESTTEDYSVIADARMLGSSTAGDFGLLGRMSPTALTYYMGRWLNGNAEIYKRVNGTWTSLGTVAYPLNANQTYTMELQMEGNVITFKIDGDPAMSVTNSDIPFGLRSGFRSTGLANTATAGIHFNNFIVKHKGDTGLPVFKRKIHEGSIAAYRRGLKRIQDNRVTVEESAELLMDSEIARNLQPRYRSNITISGNTYDIRSIKLGDLIGFRNFDNFIDDPAAPVWMQVVRLDYSGDEVKLQLDTLLPSVPKRLEDIKRNLNQEQVGDVGDEPDTELT